MKRPRLSRVEIRGFRAFGAEPQTLLIDSLLAVAWGPNSHGKTSLAEAFEFLFTGQLSRKELTASSQDEFADALRNAHIPATCDVYIEADIVAADGVNHTLRRTLVSDFAKKQDCSSRLLIDGNPAAEDDLWPLGVVVSQPPFRAPVLTQHALGYLFSAKPQERATYFRSILEVVDLEEFRNTVSILSDELRPKDDPCLGLLAKSRAIPEAAAELAPLEQTVPPLEKVQAALLQSLTNILVANGATAAKDLPAAIAGVEVLLESRRRTAFPVSELKSDRLELTALPGDAEWEVLVSYEAEEARVDEETRRLAKLYAETLGLLGVGGSDEAVDCPVCGTPGALTSSRVALLRERLTETAVYEKARKDAAAFVARLGDEVRRRTSAVAAAVPKHLARSTAERERIGFQRPKLRALVGPSGSTSFAAWEKSTELIRAAWDRVVILLRDSAELLRQEGRGALPRTGVLRPKLEEMVAALQILRDALDSARSVERDVLALVTSTVDAESKTVGWVELLNLARDPQGLRAALVERAAVAALKLELTAALKQIDRGNERVLAEKFGTLSASVGEWWERLRPEEPTFFSSVKPRPGARRTIDFKVGLAAQDDRSGVAFRDAIAVFSQSQLFCLGLALFLARSLHEGASFLVLDDPVIASDDDYRAHFAASVVEALLDKGVQLFILTQDQQLWKDLESRYGHRNAEIVRIQRDGPSTGATLIKEGDSLGAMLARLGSTIKGGNLELRKQNGEKLRRAGERFCKELLVRERLRNGEEGSVVSDFDGKALGALTQLVAEHLTKDPSHLGKLRAFASAVNPANHDDCVPSVGALVVAFGDLKALHKIYS